MNALLLIGYANDLKESAPHFDRKYIGITDDSMNDMVGRVLTALEVALPEGSQLTALKSVVKQELWRTYNAPTSDWVNVEAFEYDSDKGNYKVAGELGYPMGAIGMKELI